MPITQSSYILHKHEDAPGCVVLIFSNDRSFINHYCKMFVSLGFKRLTATAPEATILLLRLLVVTLVILDQESGVPEGCRILKRVRHLQYHAPVLVVGRTSYPNFRHEALSLGAADYLDHPAFPKDVIHAFLPGHTRQEQTVS